MKSNKSRMLFQDFNYDKFNKYLENLDKDEVELLKYKLEAKEKDNIGKYIFGIINLMFIGVIGFLANRCIEFMTYSTESGNKDMEIISYGIAVLIFTIIFIYIAILMIHRRNSINNKIKIKYLNKYLEQIFHRQAVLSVQEINLNDAPTETFSLNDVYEAKPEELEQILSKIYKR